MVTQARAGGKPSRLGCRDVDRQSVARRHAARGVGIGDPALEDERRALGRRRQPQVRDAGGVGDEGRDTDVGTHASHMGAVYIEKGTSRCFADLASVVRELFPGAAA